MNHWNILSIFSKWCSLNYVRICVANIQILMKKFGRNPKSDRDWKDRKKIERSREDRKIERRSKDRIKIEVQIEEGNKSPNRKGK